MKRRRRPDGGASLSALQTITRPLTAARSRLSSRGGGGDGVEREVGRFGITPDQEYSAAEPSDALRFSLPLPSELTADEPVTFSVQLVPVSRGKSDQAARESGNERDKGASLRLGKAEIR
jgi:hypothetical protein